MKEIFQKLTFANIFCLLLAGMCFAYFWWVSYMAFLHNDIPTDISEIKIAIIGAFGSVIGYVVGSSASSKAKDDTIDKAMNNKP